MIQVHLLQIESSVDPLMDPLTPVRDHCGIFVEICAAIIESTGCLFLLCVSYPDFHSYFVILTMRKQDNQECLKNADDNVVK